MSRVHRRKTRPMAGALVETAVVSAWVKAFTHRGLPPSLYFWASRGGLEVDLPVERNGQGVRKF